MGDTITSHATSAEVPSQAELKPPALKVEAQNASPEASMNAINAAAENKNTMNQIAGSVGGGGGTRRYRRSVSNSKSKSKSIKCTCKCKCKRCCLTRRLSRRNCRSHSRRSSMMLNESQRRIISRRIRMNQLHRKIRKNKHTKNQSGGGSTPALVPQHGASCASSAEQNCPGNSSASLLEASRQASMNAQGDQLE